MSNIQFIVLLGTIMFGASFSAPDDGNGLGAAIIAGFLYGVAIYLEWLS